MPGLTAALQAEASSGLEQLGEQYECRGRPDDCKLEADLQQLKDGIYPRGYDKPKTNLTFTDLDDEFPDSERDASPFTIPLGSSQQAGQGQE